MPAKEIEERKANTHRWFEELNKGKAAAMAAVDKFYAPDVVYHNSSGEDIRGLKDFKQSVSQVFSAFPDAHFTIDDIVVEGDKSVVRWTCTGTHKGEIMGIPATNKKGKIWFITITRRATGGKVVEIWERSDTLGFMQQLGVIPKPGKGK